MQNLIESLESDVLSLSLWCHWIWLQTTSWIHRTTWSRTIGVCEGNMFFYLQEIRSYQSCTIAVLTRISTDACHIEEWLMCEEMQKLWPNYNLGNMFSNDSSFLHCIVSLDECCMQPTCFWYRWSFTCRQKKMQKSLLACLEFCRWSYWPRLCSWK